MGETAKENLTVYNGRAMQPDRADDNNPVDPVIEAYKPGIDQTILRHNLQLTLSERLDNLQGLMKSIEEMQEVGRRSRVARNER